MIEHLRRLISAARAPRHAAVRFVLVAFILWRGALFAADFFAIHALPQHRQTTIRDFVAYPDRPLLNSFSSWDAGWYKKIAMRGYAQEGAQSSVAFFPAFPYLARWLAPVFGGTWLAGLAISNLALFFGLLYVFALARRYTDEDGARRAVTFVLIFPTSFFFSAFYTEGLFFLTVAGSLYHYEKDELWLAGLWGLAASLTRSTGVVLFPALLFGAIHRRGWRWRSVLRARLLWLAIIPIGLVAFAYLLREQVGDPLAFLKAQAGWGRKAALPLYGLINDAREVDWSFTELTDWQTGIVFDMLTTVGLFVAGGYALRRLDAGLSLFLVGTTVLPLLSGRVMSMHRFAACAIPLFIVLAMVTARPMRARFATIAMSLVLALNMVFYTHWWWAN